MSQTPLDTPTPPSWRSDLRIYRQGRVWQIFLLGLASGFPWVMIGSALSAWLQAAGVSRTEIGFLSAVATVFAINALWSPLVDQLKLPLMRRWLGQRKSWIALCQLVIAAGCIGLSQIDASTQTLAIGGFALLIAIAAATQDIAIDAFRIESFTQAEGRLQSAGAAMATAGWWTGFSGLGAVPFFIVGSDESLWQFAYLVLAGIMLVLTCSLVFMRSPATTESQPARRKSWLHWLQGTLIDPLTDFFKRNGWQFALAILSFLLLFKIGEAFLGRMSIVFYKEVGFSNEQIGTYSKLINWWVTIFFAVLGSLVNLRLGVVRGLFIGGTAMAASNLMFAWIAVTGPSIPLLISAVVVDGFTAAWSTVAFVAFISLLCNRSFTATQYALLASIGTIGRTAFASYSGWLVDWLQGNWSLFFILTALMILPSLLILWLLRHKLTALEQQFHQQA